MSKCGRVVFKICHKGVRGKCDLGISGNEGMWAVGCTVYTIQFVLVEAVERGASPSPEKSMGIEDVESGAANLFPFFLTQSLELGPKQKSLAHI